MARAEVHGVPSGTVTFRSGTGAVHRASLPATGSGAVEWHHGGSAGEPGFVRIEVRHPGGRMAALSNPVILV